MSTATYNRIRPFNVATMSTVNPVLILAAFAVNGLYRIASALIALIEWLVPALLAVLFAAALTVAKHWRVLASVAGLVAAVVLVAVFWQIVLVGVGVFGGMYAGLLVVVRL